MNMLKSHLSLVFTAILVFLLAAFLRPVFALEVPQLLELPGFKGLAESRSLDQLALAFYNFALAISALLAFGVVTWGGVLWLVSAAKPAMQLEAKKKITNAVTGVALLLGIFVILNTVNPQLTVLRDIAEQTAVTICQNDNFGPACSTIFKTAKCDQNDTKEDCWIEPPDPPKFSAVRSVKNPQNLHVLFYTEPNLTTPSLCGEVYETKETLFTTPPFSDPSTNRPENAEYYKCNAPIRSAQLKKESVVMVYEKPDFAGQYRTLRSDIANTNHADLDLNPAAGGKQNFWGAPPLAFNSVEIPAGFRVSLYSNTGMRDRCAVLTKTHGSLSPFLDPENPSEEFTDTKFFGGVHDEYYLPKCIKDGIKSLRITAGAVGKPGIVSLFDEPGFGGNAREVSDNSPLVNMRVRSLKINPPDDCKYPAKQCRIYATTFDRPNFVGKCETFTLEGDVDLNVGSLMIMRVQEPALGTTSPAARPVVRPALTLFDDVNLNEGEDPTKPKRRWYIDLPKDFSFFVEKSGKVSAHEHTSGGEDQFVPTDPPNGHHKGWGDTSLNFTFRPETASSALKDPSVGVILFEKSLADTDLRLNGELKGAGGVCEGLIQQEKDVLRLKDKVNGIYIFRLK